MDKKKAKLNVIDIIIIVVVVAAIIFVGWKLLGGGGSEPDAEQIYMTVYMEECPEYIVDFTNIGDKCYDDEGMNLMGTVTDIKIDEANSYMLDEDGNIIRGHKDGYCSVYITFLADGVITDHGASIGGVLYGVGHTFIFRAGLAKYYLRVYDIQPAA